MKEMDLLRAVNDIDEEYIEEASPALEEKKIRKPLRYRKQILAAGLTAVVLIGSAAILNGTLFQSKGAAAGGVANEMAAAEDALSEEETIAETITENGRIEPDARPAEAAGGTFGFDEEEKAEYSGTASSLQTSIPDRIGPYSFSEFRYPEGEIEAVYLDDAGRESLFLYMRTEEDCDFGKDGILEDTVIEQDGRITSAQWVKACTHFRAEIPEGISREELEKLWEETY